jgi:hypothetical protein
MAEGVAFVATFACDWGSATGAAIAAFSFADSESDGGAAGAASNFLSSSCGCRSLAKSDPGHWPHPHCFLPVARLVHCSPRNPYSTEKARARLRVFDPAVAQLSKADPSRLGLDS